MKVPKAAFRHYIDAFDCKVRGKQMTQSGAVFTVALRNIADGWRIAAWAWAKGNQ